jgi:hypothetical protein
MLVEDNQKILLGNSIQLPEDDMDENITKIDDQIDSLNGYWETTILDSIGTKNFKEDYNTVIGDIIEYVPLEEQIAFCYTILEKIYEVYDFELPQKVDIQTKQSVLNLYDFLKFLEFDHEDFVVSIWAFIKTDESTESLLETCLDNENNIMKEVEEQLETSVYPELISIFLRTYIKERFIQWFCNSTMRYESEIKIRMMEEN